MGVLEITGDVFAHSLYSPKVVTSFIDDGVGIDPDGCGCTECIIGDSIPFSLDYSRELAALAFEVINGGRKYYNRVGSDTKMIPVFTDDTYGFKLTW